MGEGSDVPFAFYSLVSTKGVQEKGKDVRRFSEYEKECFLCDDGLKKHSPKTIWRPTQRKWLRTIPRCARREDAIALFMIHVAWMAVNAGSRFAEHTYRDMAARNGAARRPQLHMRLPRVAW